MKVIVIDQLNIENKYRSDFWKDYKKKYRNVKIEIPEPINGKIVKKTSDNSFEEIDLDPYDLILIHERDDIIGYESVAIKLGKKVVIYSDAFDEQPTYQENSKVLKIKGSILYSRLEKLFTKIDDKQIIDFSILCNIDNLLEGYLDRFNSINPLESDKAKLESYKSAKKKLQDYVSEKLQEETMW